jgi:hypothetical protein
MNIFTFFLASSTCGICGKKRYGWRTREWATKHVYEHYKKE